MPNEVIYSGKHAGICLYFARLLAPLWDGKLVEENQTPDKLLISRLSLKCGLLISVEKGISQGRFVSFGDSIPRFIFLSSSTVGNLISEF